MTKKNILTIAAGIIMMVLVAFQSPEKEKENPNVSGIQFKAGSWNEILTLAKQENKPVFIDISASWCGYCKRMKANVYTDAEVSKFFNATFINFSVDGEKGEGIDLAKKYGVRGFPTFVFLNPDGSLAYQTSGYHNTDKFLKLGNDAINK